MAYERPLPDHRRKWDRDEYERLARESLATKEDESSEVPVKRDLLRPRDYKVDLDSKMGKSVVITKTTPASQQGGIERLRSKSKRPASSTCTGDAEEADVGTALDITDGDGEDGENVESTEQENDGGDALLGSVTDDIDANDQFDDVRREVAAQTDLTSQAIDQVLADNAARVVESAKLSETKSISIYDREYYTADKEKVKFYTGLPNLAMFDLVLDLVSPHMSNQTVSLRKEQELLLCLIKIRLNYPFQDVAYQLKLSVATVTMSFHRTLEVLSSKLQFLIRWPAREELQISMPMCFREKFGQKVAVIVDCFELAAEKPSGQANAIQVFSNYKHYQTTKYLIGISPQGSVSFLSDAYGGRASDKCMIEESGILSCLMPGDVIMADRGFNIEDQVQFYQAKLLIPNLTCGKKQLHPLEVENTRSMANVRIHVERVIGLVRRKFGILQKEVPLEFMRRKNGEHSPTIDKIVQVCCCIVNLHQSIVPFD